MRKLILAVALAAAPVAFALTPAMALIDTNDAGVDTLGVDISSVINTPTGVQTFLSSLAPDTRQAVEHACANYNSMPGGAGIDVQTLSFCAQVPRA